MGRWSIILSCSWAGKRSESEDMSDEESQDQILKDFQTESKKLILEMIQILEDCEADVHEAKKLEDFAQRSDRMMGTAKTLIMATPSPKLNRFADFASLCKAVGYQTAQLREEQEFYVICVALLFDATEFLGQINEQLLVDDFSLDSARSRAFLDRLNWISSQFKASVRQSVGVSSESKKDSKLNQDDIDDLIAKLGLD